MKPKKKWSEQSLMEQTLATRDENGSKVEKQVNVLEVCVSGLALYRKTSMKRFKDENQLTVPFDFVVLAGSESPNGRFYELEYFIGKDGVVFRALLELSSPVTDVRLVLGTLKRKNLLPEGFNPIRLTLRDDIDQVDICHCDKDEKGEVSIFGGSHTATEGEASMCDYAKKFVNMGGPCLEYYRGDVREVWSKPEDFDLMNPVFVAGSENVDDPLFAERRKADIEEMVYHFNEAVAIAKDYNLKYFLCCEYKKLTSDEKAESTVSANCSVAYIENVISTIKRYAKHANED